METQKQTGKGSAFGGIIILAIIIGIIGAIMNCADNSPDRAGIEDAVQQVISQGLLNPSGASFSDDSNTTITDEGNGTYEVKGYVDDTNAFGAKVRNNYDATATKKDDGSYDVSYQLQNAITGEWN